MYWSIFADFKFIQTFGRHKKNKIITYFDYLILYLYLYTYAPIYITFFLLLKREFY